MEELIEELTKVSPSNLSEEGLKLFNKINEIIDRNQELERENTRLKYQDIPYLEGTIKGYKDRVEELKQEITVLQNTKDTCPSLNTSGVRCSLKENLPRRNGKTIELAISLREEILKLPECKLYGIKNCKGKVILLTKEEVIPKSKIKEKIEEINKMLRKSHKKPQRLTVGEMMLVKTVLKELLEEE